MPKYKKISNKIERLVIDNPKTPDKKLIWINIINAGKKEIEFLRKNYNFDLKHLGAASVKIMSQRPKIKKRNDYLFLILHFPILKNNLIMASEIDFFIGHGYLISIHNNNHKALTNFFNSAKKDDNNLLAFKFESSAILLYEILEKLMRDCYQLLDQNSLSINEVENMIFGNNQRQSVSKILSLRRNIINYRKTIQNHKNIMKRLMALESSIVPSEEIKKHYLILLERSKRIWEILENQKEMVEALYDTNESLLNYQISDIMKTLTIFSVIVFPLTLLAAIFGMNTTNGMPFLENKHGFWIIIIIMLFGCLGMLIFFKKKRWL